MQQEREARRLSAGDAESLWRAWVEDGDERARGQLTLSYTPMVTFIASRKVRELPAHCDLDDLVSAGLIGLLEAIDRFDPSRGVTFEQYAWTRISGAVLDELRRLDWAPRSLRRSGRQITAAATAIGSRSGSPAADDEIAHELGVGAADVKAIREELAMTEVQSLNVQMAKGDDEGLVELVDLVEAGPGEHDPVSTLLARARADSLRGAMASLNDRERRVLALVHVHEASGGQISSLLGVSESRVSQIMSAARKKLRTYLDTQDALGAAA
jgi:RNA polymerase sigma factor for flagellar operon FliA